MKTLVAAGKLAFRGEDNMWNCYITGPPVLLAARNRGYRSPNVLGWAGHMGNVG